MTYAEYIGAMRTIRRTMQHIRDQRGTGDCQDAIARNRTLKTLADAQYQLIGDYTRQVLGGAR